MIDEAWKCCGKSDPEVYGKLGIRSQRVPFLRPTKEDLDGNSESPEAGITHAYPADTKADDGTTEGRKTAKCSGVSRCRKRRKQDSVFLSVGFR